MQTCLTILLSFDGEIFWKTLCLKKRNVHDKFKSMLAIYNVDKEKARGKNNGNEKIEK